MDTFSHVPPGFRFHPTDEELVDYYLRKKIASKKIDLDVIKEVDLYKIEPWDLLELCKIGTDEQSDWYFFSHKDKKYPTGTRTNRATKAGFWKATGRDKSIYSKHCLVGMRKTLVFYKGRAPNGQKSDWIMHEYRLETNENGTPPEEGWVVCRVFKKRMTTVRKMGDDYDSPSCLMSWYDDQVSFMTQDHLDNSNAPPPAYHHHHHRKPELQELQYNNNASSFLTLPHLESPKQLLNPNYNGSSGMQFSPSLSTTQQEQQLQSADNNNNIYCGGNSNSGNNEVTDWRVLDKFVASQLMSHVQQEQITMLLNGSSSTKEDQYASTTSTSQIHHLWKSNNNN